MTVNILGTEYTLEIKKPGEDKKLDTCDGYCDWTTHYIAVLTPEQNDDSVAEMQVYTKKVMRHEITHAFLFESGLMQHTNQGQDGGAFDEQFVDWISIQGPKIYAAWQKACAL